MARAFLRAFTWLRLLNACKAFANYGVSQWSKKVKLTHRLLALAIEPTSICNLKCPECPTGADLLKRPKGMISKGLFGKVVSEFAPTGIYLNLYVQGEPLLHSDFEAMVKAAAGHSLITSISTNGHHISKERAQRIVASGLTRLIFSVDGLTQQSYEKYRVGGDLSKVMEGLSHILEAKRACNSAYPLLVVQFIVFRHNEQEVSAFKKVMQQKGVDRIEFKTAQFYQDTTSDVTPPLAVSYRRYKDEGATEVKGKMLNKCWRQWHSAVITWDGKMAPCCYDKDAFYSFGNVNNNNTQTLWDKSEKFKKQVLQSKKSIDMCANCPEGRSRWSL